MREVCRECRHFVEAASEQDVRRSRAVVNTPAVGAAMCAYNGQRLWRPEEHVVCLAPDKWPERSASK